MLGNFNPIDFLRRKNALVLSGEDKISRIFPYQKEEEWLNTLFSSEKFKNTFLDISRRITNAGKSKPILKGFTLFGSWINAGAKHNSDFDIGIMSEQRILPEEFVLITIYHSCFVPLCQKKGGHRRCPPLPSKVLTMMV